MKTMRFVEKGSLFILVHGEQTPSEAEWNEYMAALGKHADAISSRRILVLSRGGGPNMLQRKRIKEVTRGLLLPTAVISSSQIARAIVTLIGLTQPSIAAFNPEQRREAYAHLGIAEAERPAIDAEVARLEQELGLAVTMKPAL